MSSRLSALFQLTSIIFFRFVASNANVVDLLVVERYVIHDIETGLYTPSASCEFCTTGMNWSATSTCEINRAFVPIGICMPSRGNHLLYEYTKEGVFKGYLFSNSNCTDLLDSAEDLEVGGCGANNPVRTIISDHCLEADEPEGEYLYPLVRVLSYPSLEACEADEAAERQFRWQLVDPNTCWQSSEGSPAGILRNPGGGLTVSCNAQDKTLQQEYFPDELCQNRTDLEEGWTKLTIGSATCTPRTDGFYSRATDCTTPTMFCKSVVPSGFAVESASSGSLPLFGRKSWTDWMAVFSVAVTMSVA